MPRRAGISPWTTGFPSEKGISKVAELSLSKFYAFGYSFWPSLLKRRNIPTGRNHLILDIYPCHHINGAANIPTKLYEKFIIFYFTSGYLQHQQQKTQIICLLKLICISHRKLAQRKTYPISTKTVLANTWSTDTASQTVKYNLIVKK